jgi:hypothetical protein
VRTLAIPQIGAGLDRQPWPWAKSIIEQEFAGVDTQVLIFAHPAEYPKNECRRPSYTQVTAGTHKLVPQHRQTPHYQRQTTLAPLNQQAPPPSAPPPPPLPPRQARPSAPPQQSAKIPVMDRLIADISKKDGANLLRDEQPTPPMDVPGRDGASKAVKATVTAQEGGAVCSKEACELTGALSSSALSPASEPSGEPLLISSPPAATQNAKGASDSAPELNNSCRIIDQTSHETPPRIELTDNEMFETPTATAQSGLTLIPQIEVSPDESTYNFKPTEYASQVSKHIRELTFGKKPKIPSTNLIDIMSKNTTQNNTHTVN